MNLFATQIFGHRSLIVLGIDDLPFGATLQRNVRPHSGKIDQVGVSRADRSPGNVLTLDGALLGGTDRGAAGCPRADYR